MDDEESIYSYSTHYMTMTICKDIKIRILHKIVEDRWDRGL